MKKYTYLFIVFAVFVSIYALACFISWQLNPAKWDEFGRTMYVFFSICISCGIIAALEDNEN